MDIKTKSKVTITVSIDGKDVEIKGTLSEALAKIKKLRDALNDILEDADKSADDETFKFPWKETDKTYPPATPWPTIPLQPGDDWNRPLGTGDPYIPWDRGIVVTLNTDETCLQY